jgi:hypothetical protein
MRKKIKPFDAPTGYFDSLSGRTEKQAIARASAGQRYLPRAIAASFLLLLAVGTTLLLVQHRLKDRAVIMAEQNSKVMAEELLYNTFDINESSIDPSSTAIDWDMLFDENLLNDAQPHEIAEYIFEQDDLNF